jgi:hypothetical protein
MALHRGERRHGAGPPPAAPTPRPTSSVAAWAMVPGGSNGSWAMGDTAVVARAAVVKKAADVAATKAEEAAEKKRATEEVVKKKAAEEAAMRKKATEEATTKKKAAEEVAVKKKADDEATTKKKASEEATKKTESGAATVGSDSVGRSQEGGYAQWLYTSSQAAIPRLLEASVRYTTLHLPFLVPVCDFNLVFPAYNMPSSGTSPPSRGHKVMGAALVDEPQDTVEAQPIDEAVGGGGVLVTGAVVAAGAATQVATGGGSPASEVLPVGATNVTTEEVATNDSTCSAGPSGARLSPLKRPTTVVPWSLRSSWGIPHLGPLGMSPSTRLWVRLAGRLPRPRTCSNGSVVASSMNDGACCSGLPCSRSGQRRRGQGRRLGSSTLT